MRWKLVLENLEKGTSRGIYVNKPRVRIGRTTDNDVSIPHAQVSRHHANLMTEGNFIFLEDRDSRNGTYLMVGKQWVKVNGKRDIRLPCMVRFGVVWQVRIESALAAATPDDACETENSLIFSINELQRNEAILVLDLCGSSQMANADESMAYHLKGRLNHLAGQVFSKFNARFMKSTGDGFLATFSSPQLALGAAVVLDDRIHDRNRRTDNPPIHFRISLHIGAVYTIESMGVDGADVHGNDVNIAFRIEGVQQDSFQDMEGELPVEDRILCSETFFEQCERSKMLPFPVAMRRCGVAVLKGIQEPMAIYSIDRTQSRITLSTTTGDITTLHVDAIVNAANSTLLGGGGVDGAIHQAGGPAILEACKRIRQSRYPDGLPVGKAVITTAGTLPSKYVIHTVGPVYEKDATPAKHLTDCYRNCLKLAMKKELTTIAFPSIGTGAYGYPKEAAARIAVNTIQAVVNEDPGSLREVVLVAFSKQDEAVLGRTIQMLTL
ncbi:MAG: O-acetyl-ADP-ribose deacetylase [Magnetococcales bacterium]|nr:O-acetyl-ADP-ribose deacetylase [Magnetococcales bacterium]